MNAVLRPHLNRIDAVDRRIIIATQSGLPLVADPSLKRGEDLLKETLINSQFPS